METMHKGSAVWFRRQARAGATGDPRAGHYRADATGSALFGAAVGVNSAATLREALLDLEREGLLEAERNRGFRVVSLSLGELNDIFAVRLLLEVPSVGDIARNGLSGRQLDELRQLAEATRQTAKIPAI